MKRSEAFVRIFETLETAFSHPEGNSKLAEAILETVEKIGMLPPMSNEFMGSVPFDVSDSILEDTPEMYKWDEE